MAAETPQAGPLAGIAVRRPDVRAADVRAQDLRGWLGDPGADSRWETVFLFLVAGLASTIRLKVGGIQYMELLYMLEISILLLRFQRMGLRVTMLRPLRWLGLGYVLFVLAAMVLAVTALRFNFYSFGDDPPFIRLPFWISVSHAVEFIGNSTMLIYLAESMRRSEAKLRFCMRVYFWVGMASTGFAIVSWPIFRLTGVELGVYGDASGRFRGFMNEGGPLGLYLITLFVVGRALYLKGWEPRRRIFACFALVLVGMVGAQSKAALGGIFVLLVLNVIISGSSRQRVALAALTVVLIGVGGRLVNLEGFLRNYRQQAALYEQASLYHRGDPNYVEGRVAGAFIVPRMIAAHPLTGIGWGNYGYLRNDPQYRGASAWSDFSDDPGLGLYGSAAELGVPLLLLLLGCLAYPFFLLRARGVPSYVLNLALMQPVVHLFGAQLNLTYMWVVSAFALGLAFSRGTEVVDGSHARGALKGSQPGALVIA